MASIDILITRAKVYTAESDNPIIHSAAIIIEDGIIKWLGDHTDLPEIDMLEVKQHIDNPPGWITPGFIDCHTHLIYAGNRSDEFRRQLAGETYQSISDSGGGILATVRATRAATEDDLYQLAHQRLLAWLTQGVTHLEVKSGYGLNLDTELKMLRVAQHLEDNNPVGISRTMLAAHSLPPEFSSHDAYIDHICDTILPACHAEGLVDAVDGFCENIAFDKSQLERLFECAKELGLDIKLHAEQLSNQGGSGMAATMQALSADHLEYLDQHDVSLMSKHGTIAVLLPAAFYFLNESQLPPIEELRKQNVPMAIATDHNPGSAPVMSLPLMINMACRLFGLLPEEALAGVTINAARALGIDQHKGSLRPGKQADIVAWPVEQLTDLAYYFGDYKPNWIIQAGQYRD